MTQITLLSAEPANLDQWAFLNSVRLEETEKKKKKRACVVVGQRNYLGEWRLSYSKVYNLVHMFKEELG